MSNFLQVVQYFFIRIVLCYYNCQDSQVSILLITWLKSLSKRFRFHFYL